MGTWVLIREEFLEEKFVSVVVLSNPVHLGDNYRATIGGDATQRPNPSNCYANFPSNISFVCIDKLTGEFLRNGSIPTPILKHLEQTIVPRITQVNIGAWKHVVAHASKEQFLEGEAERAIWFDGGPKVWRQNVEEKDVYYARRAPFLISFQLSLFDLIVNAGYQLDDAKSPMIEFAIEGLTGGRRDDQIDQVYVFLNDELRRILFPSTKTRDTRVLKLQFNLDAEELRMGRPVHFGIFVLPWQESGPRPPIGATADSRGPAHFQDIDVNTIAAKLFLN